MHTLKVIRKAILPEKTSENSPGMLTVITQDYPMAMALVIVVVTKTAITKAMMMVTMPTKLSPSAPPGRCCDIKISPAQMCRG